MQPTMHDLRPEEQESLARAMGIVDDMSEDERRNVIKNLLISAIYFRRVGNAEVLETMTRDLLTTLRLHASAAYKKALANAKPPDSSRQARSVKDVLASLPR